MTDVIDKLLNLQTVLISHLNETCGEQRPSAISAALDSLPSIISHLRAISEPADLDGGVIELKAHRDWCQKHANQSDRDTGRFIGADMMWATFSNQILPFIRPNRAA